MRMIEITEERISEAFSSEEKTILSFDHRFFDGAVSNDQGDRYDVILGSLILHFLIGKNWDSEKISSVFNHIAEQWLSDDGCMIWADIFPSEKNKKDEIDYWKDSMERAGMSGDSINTFMSNNMDMVNAPSADKIQESIFDIGMILEWKPTGIFKDPFNVIKISKRELIE